MSAEIQGEWVSGGAQFPLLVKRAAAFVFDKRTSQTDRPSARKDRRKKGRGGFAPRRALMQSLLLPVFLAVFLAVFLPVLLADLTKLLKCLIPKALENLAPCRPN
jgi:hypothetical protein